MRKLFIILLFSSPALAKWEPWRVWSTEIGVTPFADVYYAFSTSEAIGNYEIERAGIDLIGGVQANIPPLYLRYGLSNLTGLFAPKDTVTFYPLFAHWRTGTRFSRKPALYDLSILFITDIFGGCKFMGIVGEAACFLNISDIVDLVPSAMGGVDISRIEIFGTARVGFETVKVPDPDARNLEKTEETIGISLGAEWNEEFITPYISASITYPITKGDIELRWLVSLGMQFALPYIDVAELPSIAYPRIFRR